MLELVHADDRAAVRESLQAALHADVPLRTEFRVVQPQGVRWHAAYGRALRADGGAVRLVGVGMDVTTRKHAELALRDSREQLERVVQTMAEGLVMIDADGRYTLANRAALRMLGVATGDLVGHRYDDVSWRRVRPDGSELPLAEHPFELLRRGRREVRDLVVGIERADGERRIASLNALPLHDGDGVFAGAVLTYVDVTQRHLAEQALADSEARLAAIVGGASDAIVSVDTTGRVTLFNPAAERIFGACAAQVLGQPVQQFLPEAARPAHDAKLAAFVRSGVAQRPMASGRVQGRGADGRPIELEASISQAVVNGQPVLTAILRDVTERAAHERALEATRSELVQLTRQLLAQEKQTTRRLAQTLHDELGQTLTAMRLHWEALPALAEPLAAKQRERLSALVETANRQIRSVLGELRPPLLDDHGLAPALDNELQRQRPFDGHPALRLEVPARLAEHRWPADVEYAAFMIAREAVVNALQHADASTVVVRLEGDAGELCLTVHDDGVGGAPPVHAGRPGHLGLVGMRERALAIGASLHVHSEAGRGTIIELQWMPSDESHLPDR